MVKCVSDDGSLPSLGSLRLFLLISGCFFPGSHLHLPSIVDFRYGASFVFATLVEGRVFLFFAFVGSTALSMASYP